MIVILFIFTYSVLAVFAKRDSIGAQAHICIFCLGPDNANNAFMADEYHRPGSVPADYGLSLGRSIFSSAPNPEGSHFMAGLSWAVVFIVHCSGSIPLLDKGVVVLLCMEIDLCGATSYMLHAVRSSISYAPGPIFAANVLPTPYNQSNRSTRTPGRGTVFQLHSDGGLFNNGTAMIQRP